MAVQDEGPGLPEVPESGRVGLGLSIVTQVAEAHGGHLASFLGPGDMGTTMVVWLPTDATTGPPPARSPLAAI